ncbi:transport system permease protein [Methanococcus vannielii SB]|uniref:Transport system permease protein n=1 Tax=Methanococcus vannielii (strain ATCC 35089 / DSM 1224 / JCM 13029 / OCM 148 / SB) TaxID=406327 RepID=A6UNG8_METVS|nr:iron ABC transporter permease [Methanococcus vannielii]ABR54040.1 transport system permease protein [Methanococcus vannielii SB]
MKKRFVIILALVIINIGLIITGIYFGGNAKSISINDVTEYLINGTTGDDTKDSIIGNVRLPPILTAIFVGIGLSLCGLMLQTLFRNFLASPYTTGMTSGVLLFAAFTIFLEGFSNIFSSFNNELLVAGWIGGLVSIILLIIIASIVKDVNDIIIVSLLMSYLLGGVRSYLIANAEGHSIMNYYFFTLGSLMGVRPENILLIASCTMVFLTAAILLIKPLNALLFGEQYAKSFGLNIKQIRLLILVSTGFIVGSIIPFVGMITFVGVIAPFMARPLIKTSDHKWLMPTTLLAGVFLMLSCHIISIKYTLPFNYLLGLNRPPIMLPIGSILSIVGGVLVVYLVVSREKVKLTN